MRGEEERAWLCMHGFSTISVEFVFFCRFPCYTLNTNTDDVIGKSINFGLLVLVSLRFPWKARGLFLKEEDPKSALGKVCLAVCLWCCQVKVNNKPPIYMGAKNSSPLREKMAGHSRLIL